MPLRLLAAQIAVLVVAMLCALPGRTAEFVDSAGRHVMLPDRVDRVMAAGPTAAVLIFVLTPQKLVGWPQPLPRVQRAYLPAKFARLPTVGQLTGPYPTATADEVARLHPDLIIDSGTVSPEAAALADRIQQQTRIPYIVLDGSIQRSPEMLHTVGVILGAGDHALDASSYAYHAIQALRGRLLIRSPVGRPRVYYGRGSDGLETGLSGSLAMSDIDQAGVINVAGGLGHGQLARVSRAQIFAWNPDIIIAQQRSFYNALQRDPEWRGLAAVRAKRVYLAPAEPFAWIDDPAGVNRMVGLYWLSNLFYPDPYEQDLRTTVREFYQTFYGVQLTDRQLEVLVRPAEAQPGEMSRGANVSLFGAEPSPLPNLSPDAMPGMEPMGIPANPSGRGGSGHSPNPAGRPASRQ